MAQPRAEDQAFQAIVDMIAEHRIQPGSRIYEPELVEQLKQSRTPIRQALQKLMTFRLLERLPGRRGYGLPHLNEEDRRQIFDLREQMEAFAARWAARNASVRDIRRMKEINEKEQKIAQSPDPSVRVQVARLNEMFHRALFNASQCPYVIALFEAVYWRSTLYTFAYSPYYAPDGVPLMMAQLQQEQHYSWKEHKAIIDAVEEKDVDRSGALAAEHIVNTWKYRFGTSSE